MLSGGTTGDRRWQQALASTRDSVLRVMNETCQGMGRGSGFVYDAHTVVTNEHVVDGATRLTLDTQDGRTLSVEVARASHSDDLAFVRTRDTLPAPVTLAGRDPTPGDLIRALGFPGGKTFTVTDGRVIGYADGATYGHPAQVVKASTVIHPGSSGGPLVDARGAVVGVVFAVDVHDSTTLAIPVSRLRTNLAADLPAVTADCTGSCVLAAGAVAPAGATPARLIDAVGDGRVELTVSDPILGELHGPWPGPTTQPASARRPLPPTCGPWWPTDLHKPRLSSPRPSNCRTDTRTCRYRSPTSRRLSGLTQAGPEWRS